MAEHTVNLGILPEAVEALQLDGSLFTPSADYPVWQYTGPLDDAREWFEEHTETQLELDRGGVFTLTSFLHEGSLFWPDQVFDRQIIEAYDEGHYAQTSAVGFEEAWRNHLGELLILSGEPYAEIGAHGETLEQLRELLKNFAVDEPDYSSPGNDAEHELYSRWRDAVREGELLGFRAWVKEMSSRV